MGEPEGIVEAAQAAPAGSIGSRGLPLQGVKGWLLFFCISLTVLNPLATAIGLIYGLSGAGPVLLQYPGLLVVTGLDLLLSVALAALSLYAGVSLWRIRPGALKVARMFLLIGAVYTLVSPFMGLLAGLPDAANQVILQDALQSGGRGVVYPVLWMTYLMRSKRVAATYPDAASVQPRPR